MMTRTSRTRRGASCAAIVAAAALSATGCDDKPQAPKPRVDAVTARTAAPGAKPTITTATASAPATAVVSATPPTDASVPLSLKPARRLRDGERATAERAFSKYARFDFAQSFVVSLEGFGTCSFVTQTTEAATRARILRGDAGAVKPPAPAAAPTATATASAAATSAAVPADDPGVPSFHLVCPNKPSYDFPDFQHTETGWTFDDVAAVAFTDVDADGLTDVVVIASYMTGIGPEGAKPFPVVIVFHNEGSGSFTLNTDLSNELTQAQTDTIAKVIAHLRKKAP